LIPRISRGRSELADRAAARAIPERARRFASCPIIAIDTRLASLVFTCLSLRQWVVRVPQNEWSRVLLRTERVGVIGHPMAEGPRRRSNDVGNGGCHERRMFDRRTPYGKQHLHGRSRPAIGRLTPELLGRQGPGGWNRIHCVVDDITAEGARLRAAGVTFRSDIVTGPGGSQIVLDEPSGNLVELFQPAGSR
jgi:hypothetical protein